MHVHSTSKQPDVYIIALLSPISFSTIQDDKADMKIKCKTQKDRVKLNYSTAGIFNTLKVQVSLKMRVMNVLLRLWW